MRQRLEHGQFAGVLVRNLRYWPSSLRRELETHYHADQVFPGHELTYTLYLPNR
jgi:hypothetical protein